LATGHWARRLWFDRRARLDISSDVAGSAINGATVTSIFSMEPYRWATIASQTSSIGSSRATSKEHHRPVRTGRVEIV
jgi:hypothetical protein